MTDPRLIDWLRALSPAERSGLFASRAVLIETEWARLPEETRTLLGSANVKPVLVPDHAGVTWLFQRLAEWLAPLPVHELVFDLEPGETVWTVTGPTPESPAHTVPNPLADPELMALLTRLKGSVSQAVSLSHPQADLQERQLELLGSQVSQKLTLVLLSEAARDRVLERLNHVDRGRPRLVLRVADASPRGDQALALPWELLAPKPGEFAVKAGRLDLVREAVVAGGPGLPEPTGPLTVAVTVAAPEDQGRLNYEAESFRLQAALSTLGQKAAFADLGGVADLVEVVEGQKAAVVHFSGHGLPGHLVFEDDYGFSQKVSVAELADRLHRAVPEPGSFPRLFFLASCHGTTGGSAPVSEPAEEAAVTREPRTDLAAALGEGPSTAAVLHRSGFVQVIGYFGPVGDELCTRAEETFYRALAEGRTTLHAVSEARETLTEPLEIDGESIRYPLGWAQLAVYHRGADRPLAVGGEKGKAAPAERFRRRLVQVSGLPVLEQGFIGRRALQHDIRRRVEKDGRHLIVLQGLGGLGKTALASQLLARTFAPEPPDQLILRCRGLESEPDPASILRAQAEEHGRIHNFPDWDEGMKYLQEKIPNPAAGFAAVVREIREERPSLVLYADNTETLQDGPQTDDPKALGSWRPEAAPWWKEIEGLSREGLLILASTRYFWKGGDPRTWVGIGPMSRADVLRMLDSYDTFEPLGRQDRERLARRVDGHPRTVEVLERLVSEHWADLGPGYEMKDPWTDLVEPVLPRQEKEISADLLLEELWQRLTPEAQRQSRQISVLRVPAPRQVIDGLGNATEELVRTGLLTLYRELGFWVEEQKLEWVDRWGLHSLVRAFVETKTSAEDRRSGHLAAGTAYQEWVTKPDARWSEHVEGIHHLHSVGEGDQAWPMVQKYVFWQRRRARYREALTLLETCEAAGTTADLLALALLLQAQMRHNLGERSEDLAQMLGRAASLASSDETKASVLNEHGILVNDRGEYEEAEKLLRRALALKEKAALSLSVAHPSYGASLHELARVLSNRGKYGEAEALLRQLLANDEKSLGMAHPDYGASLHELANVLTNQGKYGEAEALLRQSLALLEKSLGVAHPSLYPTLSNLAVVLAKQQRGQEGEPFLRRALAIALETHGPAHPEVAQLLNVLAQLQAMLGQPEAPETARHALAALNETLGADHPTSRNVAPLLERIASGGTIDPLSRATSEARAAAQSGDLATAVAAQEKAVALAREANDAREALVRLSDLLFNLALFYGRVKRHEDAVRALEEVVALDERTGHPDLESDRQALEEARRQAALTPEEREALVRAEAAEQARAAAVAIRDQVIAALRGGTDRTDLAARVDKAAEQVAAAAESGAPERELATYLRAVAAVLRGEPAPEVPPGFAEPLTAIMAAMQEGSP